MPSPESLRARKSLTKETVDPTVSIAEERSAWNAYAEDQPFASSVTFTMTELGGVACGVASPNEADCRAVILYAHGGGLTAGSVVTHRALAARIAEVVSCDVVLPEYRLLPEHAPSAPSDDLLHVYEALIADDPARPIFLGGDSSGAGLAISVAVRLHALGKPGPAGCFSISGAFDATLSGASIRSRESADPILSEAVLRHWQGQFGADFDFANPLISPLFAALDGLPPVLLMVGEDEVWFDDTARMHEAAQSAGVASEMRVFEGMWHVWPMDTDLPESEDAFWLIKAFVQRHS